ncbi:isopenicillin N synthase family oxygenase [Rhodococcus sp. WS3]|uniref:isopenicillin N synthase family dioxygenase n=1 Tax=Rhodococcus sp. WS3 TaxID=2486271 RepID=UPI001144341C|nr:2-oxoglutarate and iron-dependent oxygenase domain-containing protein [Rhodococcus sp. WS3]ROZ44158.1 isopenicillin N synthase family oxygenase [Rhodococcus sp. WS3]
MNTIPLVDLEQWRTGSSLQRAKLSERVDQALQGSGFLLISGHGIDPELRAQIRAAGSAFFTSGPATKHRYRTHVGGRGWIPSGAEANAFVEEAPGPADLKETYTNGWDDYSTGDPVVDNEWFAPNVWPTEVPEFERLCATYTEQMRSLAAELLTVFASALNLDPDWFTSRTDRAPHSFNLNRYPAMAETGIAIDGQYRIAPHTDFGVITILDRQAGYGGLQVDTGDGSWVNAPFVDDAFTINIGDLMARWTGDRWRSTRHRVLPPSAHDPNEELISLIFFFEANHDAVIESFGPPIGRAHAYQPVTTADYLRARYSAITI